MTCKVSVIIPVWNTGEYLSDSIESAIKAIHGVDAEIILVDDHSTDAETIKVIDRYQSSYACIFSYKNFEGKKGAGSARNSGVDKAVGEWLVFLDSDDVFLEKSIINKLSVADKNPSVCWMASDFQRWRLEEERQEDGFFKSRIGDYSIAEKAYGEQHYVVLDKPVADIVNDYMPVNTISVMIKRDSFVDVGGFAEDLIKAEDNYLWIKMAKRFNGFAFIPEVHAKYRIRSDSLTHEDAAAGVWIARMLKKLYCEDGLFETQRWELRKKISNAYKRDCFYYRKKREWGNVFLSALCSLRWNPGNVDSWKSVIASISRRE